MLVREVTSNLEKMGILCSDDVTNKADEAGVKLVVDDSSDAIELHHAKDMLTVALQLRTLSNRKI